MFALNIFIFFNMQQQSQHKVYVDQEEGEHKESNQQMVLHDQLWLKRATFDADQNDNKSMNSSIINVQNLHNEKNNNSSSLSSQLKKQIRKLQESAKQEDDLDALKRTVMHIGNTMLKLTQGYGPQFDQCGEFFDNEPSNIFNGAFFKSQREKCLLTTQIQQLEKQRQQICQKLESYKALSKERQENCKLFVKKYKDIKTEHLEAKKRVAYLQKKNLRQQQHHSELVTAYEQNIQVLNQKLKGLMCDQIRTIAETYEKNVADLKHFFKDQQSQVILKKQSALVIDPKSQSYQLIQKITSSSSAMAKRLKYLKKEFKQSKIMEWKRPKSNFQLEEDHQQVPQSCEMAQDSDSGYYQKNYKLGLEHNDLEEFT